jgi:hypothetical protein
MEKLEDPKAIETAKELGEHMYDWTAVKDGKFEIVCKYLSAQKALDSKDMDWTDQGLVFGFILDHVAYPDRESVTKRMLRRPFLSKYLEGAILKLYGAAEEAELGKA